MRVRIDREGAESGGGLTESEPVADAVVRTTQTADQFRRLIRVLTMLYALARRDQQFGDHVPVGAPNTLVAVHAARSAGEAMVIEDSFVEFDRLAAMGGSRASEDRISLKRIEYVGDVTPVAEWCRETNGSATIGFDEASISGSYETDEERVGAEVFRVQHALVAEGG